MMRKFLRRTQSERGSVGVLMALFIMVAIGSLVMTWNTVQLSKEKMRLQAAADSAALSACVWQARGMNAVQNINDDMYVMLSIATKLLSIATPIQAMGVAFWAARFVPFMGPVFQAIAIGSFSVALLLGGTSAWMVAICRYLLDPLGTFYTWISPFMGYWGAQQLAARNGATRLVNQSLIDEKGETIGNFGIFAAGTTEPAIETFMLPLTKYYSIDAPWCHGTLFAKIKKIKDRIVYGDGDESDGWELLDEDTLQDYGRGLDIVDNAATKSVKGLDIWTNEKLVPKTLVSVHKLLQTGKSWKFRPYVSKKDAAKNAVLPKPLLFVARREAGYIETMGMDHWDSSFSSRPAAATPMIAVAAAQCITGDVLAHSKTVTEGANNRPSGFGTGATAKLVPVSDFIKLKAGASGLSGGIFH